jgi:hypothetical protein
VLFRRSFLLNIFEFVSVYAINPFDDVMMIRELRLSDDVASVWHIVGSSLVLALTTAAQAEMFHLDLSIGLNIGHGSRSFHRPRSSWSQGFLAGDCCLVISTCE